MRSYDRIHKSNLQMRLPITTAFVFYSEFGGFWGFRIYECGLGKHRIHKSLFTNAVIYQDRICK